jgi:hypothetical protein
MRLCAPGWHGLTGSGAAGEVARLASAAAGGRATDSVDAVATRAVASRSADLSETPEPTRPGVAELPRGAVGIARTDGNACRLRGGVAGEREAGLGRRRLACSSAVACAHQRVDRGAGGARGSRTLGPCGVELAPARAIAEPGRAAAGGPLVLTQACRIASTDRYRRAGAYTASEGARHTAPRAGGGTANALRADRALAVGTLLANGAVGLEPARARAAVLALRAVAIAGAGRFAGVQAADEGKAGDRSRCFTTARTVTGPGSGEGAPGHPAAGAGAGGPLLILLTGP